MRSFLNEYTTTTSAHNLTGIFLQKMRRNTIPTEIFGVTVVEVVLIHETNRIRPHISLTDATASPARVGGRQANLPTMGWWLPTEQPSHPFLMIHELMLD